MYGSELFRHLLEELEEEFCRCGAGLDRVKPASWHFCDIHARCKALAEAFRQSSPIN